MARLICTLIATYGVQPRILAAALKQFGMRALLYNTARTHDKYAISILNRGQPVRYYYARTILHQPIQASLYQHLALVVKRAGSLIEYHDRRVLQKYPRQTYPLPLTTRKHYAARAYQRLIPVRQAAYELIGVSLTCSLLYLLIGRVGHAIADIIGYRAVEYEYLLLHNAYVCAQAVQ